MAWVGHTLRARGSSPLGTWRQRDGGGGVASESMLFFYYPSTLQHSISRLRIGGRWARKKLRSEDEPSGSGKGRTKKKSWKKMGEWGITSLLGRSPNIKTNAKNNVKAEIISSLS